MWYRPTAKRLTCTEIKPLGLPSHPKLLTSDFISHLENWYCFALFCTLAHYIEVWHTHGIITAFQTKRSTLGKVCMRKFGTITWPLVKICKLKKITKSTLAVKILRMAINWLNFLCQIKKTTNMLSPPNTYLCWHSAASV